MSVDHIIQQVAKFSSLPLTAKLEGRWVFIK